MQDVAVAGLETPGAAIVRGVNWQVQAGEFWVVGGLPGSGKTDLLMTAAGMVAPLSGSLQLFGELTSKRPEEELVRLRRRVGVVFGQEGRLFSHLTVGENLALPICYHENCTEADAQDRIDTVMEKTDLNGLASRYPTQIHRSLRIRIALARALMLEPELLLLDDPLRSLDPRQARWWLGFLNSLCPAESSSIKRMTLVVTTDDFRLWINHASHFALIDNQALKVVGGRTELMETSDPLLRELLPDAPQIR